MMNGQPRKIWKAGVALSDAWLYFAADPVRSDHKSKPGFAGAFPALKDVVENTRDGKLILSALQTAGQAHLEELESRKPLQDALLETLASDGLMATGYGTDEAPVLIEPDVLAAAHPDWENNRIQVNGTIYEKVRITDPAAMTAEAIEIASVDATVDEQPLTPAQMRANSIIETLEALIADDGAFGDLKRKAAAQLIRERMGASYEKGNGLSDPNLARYIRRKCGAKVQKAPA